METDQIAELATLLLGEFREKGLPGLIKREARFPGVPGKVRVALGMRRVGKTYFLYQKIGELLDQKIPWERIFYLNLEDERLLPLDAKKLGALVDAFYALYPDNHQHTCYLFFDEIQNAEQWPILIRRLLDTKKVEIFLSGSSAKLLSKEIATTLRGRSLSREIWPYSFMEYAQATNTKIPDHVAGPATRDPFKKALAEFLSVGGFPETVLLDPIDRRNVLQDYVHSVVYRDIVERYQVSHITLLKRLIKTLLAAIGSPISVHKCYNDFKSQGLAVSKNTLHDYLGYINDAYLAFTVPLFTESVRKRESNPRKIYAIDTGLAAAHAFFPKENLGHLFENLVYLDLRRKECEVHYFMTQEGYEIDFVAQYPNGDRQIYQVCWDTTEETVMTREQRALKAGMRELGLTGMLVTPYNYQKFLDH